MLTEDESQKAVCKGGLFYFTTRMFKAYRMNPRMVA
jgi:hypothetical protein